MPLAVSRYEKARVFWSVRFRTSAYGQPLSHPYCILKGADCRLSGVELKNWF
jgi:hypothetical protein